MLIDKAIKGKIFTTTLKYGVVSKLPKLAHVLGGMAITASGFLSPSSLVGF